VEVQLLSKRALLSLVREIEGSTNAASKVIMIKPIFFSVREEGILADLKV